VKPTIDDIRAAAGLLDGQIVKTPTVHSAPLSTLLDATIYLKLETLQRTGSFKDRGACVKLERLSPKQKKAGVIAMSAGNHAQGVAYHAQRLGIPATIVMPEGTPFTKVVRTQAFGAHIELFGATVQEAKPHADAIAKREGLTFVHPYDDADIIAGQGTIALEMLAAQPDLECLVVPIGGGGLVSGVGLAAKALKPGIELIGVEAELFPSMYQTLNGLPATSGGETLAEGIAVKTPGKKTAEIAREVVDDIVVVNEAAIEAAVQTMLETGKVLAEGAGAVGLAAVMEHTERFAGRTLGLPVCGANIDSRILASILLRGMIRAGRMVRLRVEIKDAPGALGQIADQIGKTGGNIVEVFHQRMFYDVPVKQADLDIIVETRDSQHVEQIMRQLQASGYNPILQSETAVQS